MLKFPPQMISPNGLCVGLLVLVSGFLLVPTLANFNSLPKTQKNLNDSASLSCDVQCSGLVQWKKKEDVVAECGPGSEIGLRSICSVNEGISFITIPLVNFSTRGLYSTYCMGNTAPRCLQFLQLLPPKFSFERDAGEYLELDLYIYESVRIMLMKPGNTSPVLLCSVNGRQYQCLHEHQHRVRIIKNTFYLMNLMPSDCGNYTIEEEDGTLVSTSYLKVSGEKISNTLVLASTETKNPDFTHFFISTVNDVEQSWIWKNGYEKGNNDGYEKGNNDGYQKGFWVGALGFGTGGVILGILAMYVWPLLLYQVNKWVQVLRRRKSSPVNQTEEKEMKEPYPEH
ncbi:uncharacterized protein [Hoplias malabaricus]|uniref:uncharacterized protein isoform X1 n=2 Tax=Hoplias malabaricus TaxID=27720 RepID=UPI003461A542